MLQTPNYQKLGSVRFFYDGQEELTSSAATRDWKSSLVSAARVKSGKFGHQVNSDTGFQTVEIQMRRRLMSRLIRIFTVC